MTDITLLDGGMGQELVRRSGKKPTPLWSTQVMIDSPGLVAEVHADFRNAGATVHTANTYAILRDRLVDTGLETSFEQLQLAALKEVAGDGRIAGSIGPLRASYRPDLHPARGEAVPEYQEIAELQAPHVDLILGETIASVQHASSLLEGALAAGKPVWLSMTLDDEDGTKLRSGEPLADAVAVAKDGAEAVLVNCSAPEAIDAALDILAQGGLPFGAYANGFEQITKDFLKAKPTVDALHARRDLTPTTYAEYVMGWIGKGATIVGGCCEVGPAHIAAMAEAIRADGHRIV